VDKLRRLADSIEHEREGDNGEVEFQMKWMVPEK